MVFFYIYNIFLFSVESINTFSSILGVSEGSVASWELRVEGRLLEDSKSDPNKVVVTFKPVRLPLLYFQSPSLHSTGEAKVFIFLQISSHRTRQGTVRSGQSFGRVAPNSDDSRNGRLSSINRHFSSMHKSHTKFLIHVNFRSNDPVTKTSAVLFCYF